MMIVMSLEQESLTTLRLLNKNKGYSSTRWHLMDRGSLTVVESNVVSDMQYFSKRCPQFIEGLYLDSLLVDYDINTVLEKYVGYNYWEAIPLKICKVCYKDDFSKVSLPKWASIKKEAYKL